MTSGGVAKVSDFGLAKAKGSAVVSVEGQPAPLADGRILVASGGLTQAYCSPEQGFRISRGDRQTKPE